MKLDRFNLLWWGCWIGLVLTMVAFALLTTGCASWPTWLGGDATLSNPSPDRPDVLTDPFGHVMSWVRTLLQWAVILGIVMLFPRPRAMLMPIVSWMWRPSPQPVKDAVLAIPRAVGLARESAHQRAVYEAKKAEKAGASRPRRR